MVVESAFGQQMLERWEKVGCENATVGKNELRSEHTYLDMRTQSVCVFILSVVGL